MKLLNMFIAIMLTTLLSQASDTIKKEIKVSENISVGEIKPPKKDPRIYTDKDIKKHKESMSGKSTVGIKVSF